MTTMDAMHMLGEKSLNILLLRTKGPMSLGLGMYHWGCQSYKISLNSKLRLTMI